MLKDILSYFLGYQASSEERFEKRIGEIGEANANRLQRNNLYSQLGKRLNIKDLQRRVAR